MGTGLGKNSYKPWIWSVSRGETLPGFLERQRRVYGGLRIPVGIVHGVQDAALVRVSFAVSALLTSSSRSPSVCSMVLLSLRSWSRL